MKHERRMMRRSRTEIGAPRAPIEMVADRLGDGIGGRFARAFVMPSLDDIASKPRARASWAPRPSPAAWSKERDELVAYSYHYQRRGGPHIRFDMDE